jgi:hypothetical protein
MQQSDVLVRVTPCTALGYVRVDDETQTQRDTASIVAASSGRLWQTSLIIEWDRGDNRCVECHCV